MKGLIFLILILFLSSCQSTNNVIYKDSNEDYLSQLNITGTSYELSEVEILSADSLFRTAINSHNSINPDLYINPKKYWLQYIAYIDKRNVKKILVNGFCKENNAKKSLLQSPIMVFDGGDCYFLLTINLSRNSFSEISINDKA